MTRLIRRLAHAATHYEVYVHGPDGQIREYCYLRRTGALVGVKRSLPGPSPDFQPDPAAFLLAGGA